MFVGGVLTPSLRRFSVNMHSKHTHFTGLNTCILSELSELFFLERRKPIT
jgi:hypothetical protein